MGRSWNDPPKSHLKILSFMEPIKPLLILYRALVLFNIMVLAWVGAVIVSAATIATVGKPLLLMAGFTFGFMLAIAFALFSTGAILERMAEEKTRLAIELDCSAVLTQSAKLSALSEM